MEPPQFPSDGPLSLSTDVFRLRVRVTTSPGAEGDHRLWTVAQADEEALRQEIRSALHERLGPGFEIRAMTMTLGSLEILILIGTVLERVYSTVAGYKDFVDSVNLLIGQVRAIVSRFFGARVPEPLSVDASWTQGPALADPTRGSLAWFEQLRDGFQRAVYHAMEPGLTLAQIVVFIVSLVTTYWGFTLALPNPVLAAAAALGLQSMLFWIPRRLFLSRPWQRRLAELSMLVAAFTVSVLFSYEAFVDRLVPRELRELRSLESAFLVSEPVVNRALAGIAAAVGRVDAAVRKFNALAERELKEGGTKGGALRKGHGPIRSAWLGQRDTESARLKTLQGFQDQAQKHVEAIAELRTDDKKPPSIRQAELRERVNLILALAQNPFVLQVLGEESASKTVVDDLKNLTVPSADEGLGSTSDSMAVRDRFVRGLAVGAQALADLWAGRDVNRFGIAALVALFLACVIDVLTVVLGLLGAARFIPPDICGLIENAAGAGRMVRHGRRIGLRIERDADGGSGLRRSQELALEALDRFGWLKLVSATANPGEVYVFHKDALSGFIAAEARHERR